MSSPEGIGPVSAEETLARFVLYNRWIRASNNTVRPEAFMPHPYQKLSVTRHLGLSDQELWDLGRDVATSQQMPLLGRADIQVDTVLRQGLTIKPDEPPRNHANIEGFPPEKSAQKSIAMKIAAEAGFVDIPSPVGEGNR
jgi:hypothetical protein